MTTPELHAILWRHTNMQGITLPELYIDRCRVFVPWQVNREFVLMYRCYLVDYEQAEPFSGCWSIASAVPEQQPDISREPRA